jgi:hypothetical protein
MVPPVVVKRVLRILTSCSENGQMSTANIISIEPSDSGEVIVTFSLRDGVIAKYLLIGINAAAVLMGRDPKNLSGTRI